MYATKYDLLCIRCRIITYFILFAFLLMLILFIVLCNTCVKNIPINYLLLTVSASTVIMTLIVYVVIKLYIKLRVLSTINSLTDEESDNIDSLNTVSLDIDYVAIGSNTNSPNIVL